MRTLRLFSALLTIVISLTVMGQNAPVYTVPASGPVPEIKEIHLYFDGSWSLGSNRSGKITLSGPNGFFVPAMKNVSTGTYVVIYVDDNVTITTPGEYILTLPAGKYAVNNVDLPRTEIPFTVTGEIEPLPEYTLSPQPGFCQGIPDGFRFTFDTDEAITVDTDNIYMFGPSGDIKMLVNTPEGLPYIDIKPLNAAGSPIALTEVGDYILTLSYGAIHVGSAYNNKPMNFVYHVTHAAIGDWTGEITVNPADGSVLESIKNITVTYVGAGEVYINQHAPYNEFPVLINKTTGHEAGRGLVIASGNTLDINMPAEVTTPGEYEMVIYPSIAYIDQKFATEAIHLNYTIEGNPSAFEYTYTVAPEEGATIGPDSSVSITFASETPVTLTHNEYAWGMDAPRFTNTIGGYNPSIFITDDDLTSTLSHIYPFEVEGEYTLIIPDGFYTLTNEASETVKVSEIRINYNVLISGITNVSTDTRTTDVYNLQGIRVLRDATPDALRSLPAGIYIVNGKKITINR